MDRDAALTAIEELVDRQTGVGITLMQRNQQDLADDLHSLCMAWRALALKLGGITLGETEQFERHLESKGE